jgi:hypothetical protein
MPEKEIITNPTMGSNEVGAETSSDASTGVSAGTDTQLHLAASGHKHKKDNETEQNKDINDDELVVKNQHDTSDYLESDDTDE